MYPTLLLSHGLDDVKANILSTFTLGIDRIFALVDTNTNPRTLEQRIWEVLLESGQMFMSTVLSLLCCRAAEEDIRARGLTDDQVRLRDDDDYRITMMTTFGPATFFSFAYRDSSSGVTTVTRTPAREKVFPLHKHCHSSELCLEWETKLGQEMPFRRAQASLSYFTHGAVSLEDTTIERHMVIISRLIEQKWLYQSPETIREVLRTQATRDLKTGRPLIYLSTDAHALRQFVDETWDARWKMANGLRLWCVDRHSGRIIHLGGEYTWGDCHQVGKIVDWLIETGRVPADGDYGDGVLATVVLPTDGMLWFKDYVISKFTDNAVPILDAYHAVLHLKAYAAERFGKDTPAAKELCQKALWLLFGKPREKKATSRKRRRGKIKNADTPKGESSRHCFSWEIYEQAPISVEVLIDQLLLDKDVPAEAMDAHNNFIDYLEKNAYRMNYLVYRSRGYQLGSGAMESLHRSASQIRLKLPGLKSLPETSQAIFNLRMLELNGRWDEFFQQPDFYDQLVKVFSTKPEPSKEVLAEVISMVPEQIEDALDEVA
jgi:hypothetical protein